MTAEKKQNIAIAIALVFHGCGLFGILFTPYKDWFIQCTYINLIVVFGLILFTNYKTGEGKTLAGFQKHFLAFIFIAATIGFAAEVIGVNTNKLFGEYKYGNILGIKYYNVPALIGIQWFVTLYCCGVAVNHVSHWANKKVKELGGAYKEQRKWQAFSMIFDAAITTTLFDFVMEPAAQKLGYWQWANNEIPFYNYACWFVISALIFTVFHKLQFNKLNKFAIHLLFIQSIFFMAIRLFL